MRVTHPLTDHGERIAQHGAKKPSMSTPEIAVVGAGVIGLSCAIRLQEKGFPVDIYAEKQTPDTTSDRAGAVFSPFRIDGHPAAARWTKASYHTFVELAEQRDAFCGVSMTTLRELFFAPLEQHPWWSEFVQGYERLGGIAPRYADAVTGVMPKMDMRRYMPWLTRQFVVSQGGSIVLGKLARLDALFDLGYRVIVNCSGLGAGELVKDRAMRPRRGQLLHVAPIAGLDECIVEDSCGATATYVFPFEDYTVLGGTYELYAWSEVPQEADLAAIVERCRAMLVACGYPAPADFAERPLRTLAGLRPSRCVGDSDEAVRIECERLGDHRWIVHNYGHGRAGVTLSWGCADQAADLVEEALGR